MVQNSDEQSQVRLGLVQSSIAYVRYALLSLLDMVQAATEIKIGVYMTCTLIMRTELMTKQGRA